MITTGAYQADKADDSVLRCLQGVLNILFKRDRASHLFAHPDGWLKWSRLHASMCRCFACPSAGIQCPRPGLGADSRRIASFLAANNGPRAFLGPHAHRRIYPPRAAALLDTPRRRYTTAPEGRRGKTNAYGGGLPAVPARG